MKLDLGGMNDKSPVINCVHGFWISFLQKRKLVFFF